MGAINGILMGVYAVVHVVVYVEWDKNLTLCIFRGDFLI